MSRRPANVTQADIARAIRAVDQCAYEGVVEIAPGGIIRIIPVGIAGITAKEPVDDDAPVPL